MTQYGTPTQHGSSSVASEDAAFAGGVRSGVEHAMQERSCNVQPCIILIEITFSGSSLPPSAESCGMVCTVLFLGDMYGVIIILLFNVSY